MNTNSKRLGLYIAAMLLLTSVATTLRTIACITQLDDRSGLFNAGSLIKPANAIILVCVFLMLSCILTTSRVKLSVNYATSATYVPSGILSVATVFLGMNVLSRVTAVTRYPLISKEMFSNYTVIISIIVCLLACLSVAHHFYNAFITEPTNDLRAYFAMATVVFFTFYTFLIYLDESIALNDPNKILRQIAFLSCAIFFLFETRISLGREMWRLYCAFGLVGASLAAYTSIPAIITYYANGKIVSAVSAETFEAIKNKVLFDSLASIEESVLLLAAFIFIIARVCLIAASREEEENELIKILSDYAQYREEKVAESFDRHQQIFASKQLSIFDLYGEEKEEETEEPTVTVQELEIIEKEAAIISDDVIYESIFGKMPDHPESIEEEPTNETYAEEREPEEIAQSILNAVDEALKEGEKEEKENNI